MTEIEFKIETYEQRCDMITALAVNGYKVKVEERDPTAYTTVYYVVVEVPDEAIIGQGEEDE